MSNVDAMRDAWLNQDRSQDDEEPAIDTQDGSEFEGFEFEVDYET